MSPTSRLITTMNSNEHAVHLVELTTPNSVKYEAMIRSHKGPRHVQLIHGGWKTEKDFLNDGLHIVQMLNDGFDVPDIERTLCGHQYDDEC